MRCPPLNDEMKTIDLIQDGSTSTWQAPQEFTVSKAKARRFLGIGSRTTFCHYLEGIGKDSNEIGEVTSSDLKLLLAQKLYLDCGRGSFSRDDFYLLFKQGVNSLNQKLSSLGIDLEQEWASRTEHL